MGFPHEFAYGIGHTHNIFRITLHSRLDIKVDGLASIDGEFVGHQSRSTLLTYHKSNRAGSPLTLQVGDSKRESMQTLGNV